MADARVVCVSREHGDRLRPLVDGADDGDDDGEMKNVELFGAIFHNQRQKLIWCYYFLRLAFHFHFHVFGPPSPRRPAHFLSPMFALFLSLFWLKRVMMWGENETLKTIYLRYLLFFCHFLRSQKLTNPLCLNPSESLGNVRLKEGKRAQRNGKRITRQKKQHPNCHIKLAFGSKINLRN
jgi:hypothetical protein